MVLVLRSAVALLLASLLAMIGVASVSADAGTGAEDRTAPVEEPAGESPQHADEPSDESPETDCIAGASREAPPPHRWGLRSADAVPFGEVLDPPSPPPRR